MFTSTTDLDTTLPYTKIVLPFAEADISVRYNSLHPATSSLSQARHPTRLEADILSRLAHALAASIQMRFQVTWSKVRFGEGKRLLLPGTVGWEGDQGHSALPILCWSRYWNGRLEVHSGARWNFGIPLY